MPAARRPSPPRFSLPGLELARFRRAVITRLALLAVVLVPLVYGGLYLSANHDPVGELGDLRAAVVDADEPVTVTGADGAQRTLDAGRDLVDTLTGPDADAGFTWESTTGPEADAGLEDGTYAAVLRVPEGFSAALASGGGDDPRQARLSVTTDDAQNYVLGQIADTVATAIRTEVATGATEDVLENVYVAFGSIHDSLGEAADGAGDLAAGARSADEGARQLVVGLGDLRGGAAELADGTGALRAGAGDLADGTATLAEGAGGAADGAASLSAGLERLRAGTADLPTQTDRLADGAEAVAAGAAQVEAATGELAAAADRVGELGASAEEALPALDELVERARALAAANPDDTELAAAVERLEQLRDALAGADLAAAAQQVEERVDGLAAGARELSAGAESVAGGARSLADAAPTLRDGAASAADGAAALAAGTGRVAAGARSAADGAAGLAAGAARVDDGAAALLGGTSQARSGAGDLAEGTGQLAQGAGTLAGQLREGQGEVPSYGADDVEERAGVVAAPVEAERVRENAVPHYSDGLAPLFIPVALWVGGMVTYMVLRAVSPRALASTAGSLRTAVAGLLPGAVLGVLQAVVLITVLLIAVGIESPSPLATVVFTALVAVAFTALHQGLNALLGGVGRLVALVLLVLQLTSAGGTYPVATSPAFFGAIHPYLPMTYATDGLRHLIGGGSAGAVRLDAAVLAAFAVLGLAVTVLACHRRRTWTVAELHPSLSL
ncbi:YhgE/Pip family protein [Paenibacillus sp. TRM 82003]|uniref:YhgE/Pip domain-containing protein n=1 Tax=Kineococcus sp. TRM81007 TaxID=2925831 RepID=UPI001F59AFE6|nr:YhgE/Pip domain-containing protein [Kineococcus sp. TRM81007]MCI2239587.1 YhgE/Pip family protein [Kineococcus sp. TRM81007]MCI3926131.1 YhgE/Pip family protein [Paenibacillus sp. TRM 82003]